MRRLLFLIPMMGCIGCAGTKMMTVKVLSEPSGAQVDVNGLSMGNTPTEVQMECSRTWVGLMYSPDGWQYNNTTYEVTVYPSATNPGYSQTKNVNPCQWKGDQPAVLSFDLGLEKVTPTSKVELNQNIKTQNDDQKETLKNLKKLRDQGVLSEAEYKDKVLKVIEKDTK